jgi:hypothetical protein
MKRLLLAVILSAVLSFPAMAQYYVTPSGGIAPDGGLNYVFPVGYPFQTMGPHFPGSAVYWTSYPMIAVPGIAEQGPGGPWQAFGHQPWK